MTLPLSHEELVIEDRKRWINATIESIKKSRCFNMCDWNDCIAGHACRASGKRIEYIDDALNVTSDLFHISSYKVNVLCCSSGAVEASRRDAIRTLQRLRDTGIVCWD